MACYFRHMKDILDEAGIEVTADNRKEIDRMIHKKSEFIKKQGFPDLIINWRIDHSLFSIL